MDPFAPWPCRAREADDLGRGPGRRLAARSETPGLGSRTSADEQQYPLGLLLYRLRDGRVQVRHGHPDGALFGHKDLGNWSIYQGETAPDDADLELMARREFEEETGHRVHVR